MQPAGLTHLQNIIGSRIALSVWSVLALVASLAGAAGIYPVMGVVPGLAFALLGGVMAWRLQKTGDTTMPTMDASGGLVSRATLVQRLGQWLHDVPPTTRTAVLLIEIDHFRMLEEMHDRNGITRLLQDISERLCAHLRAEDVGAQLGGPVFAIALSPSTRLSMEILLQLSARLQSALRDPFDTPNSSLRITASIGFALSDRVETCDSERLIQAATSALIAAQRNGPGAVRSFSHVMRTQIETRNALVTEVAHAFRNKEITAFFQPQIQLRTGDIIGFEALTRWQHPKRGLVPPADFLPALEQSGRMPDLGNLMVTEALNALAHWDQHGQHIARVGVNFSGAELRDPHLVSRIALLLDARNLSPERLVVEVLETVVANTADDTIAKNLAGLADLGCGIDLDDFGTGYASITNIRRLSIERIKIDRSFITRIDSDSEQQDMVAAILTMADRLGLETLAEGVETPAEQDMLARLGCQYAQGFLFGRPMPLSETDDWISAHRRGDTGAIPLRRPQPQAHHAAIAATHPGKTGKTA